MTTIHQLSTVLDELELRYRHVDANIVALGFVTETVHYELFMAVNGPIITLTAPKILKVPADRLDEVIRLANRLNAQHVVFGAFWVEPKFEFLAFQVDVLAPGDVTKEQIALAIAGLGAIEVFFPTFARAVWFSEPRAASRSEAGERPAATDEEAGRDRGWQIAI